MQWSEKYRPKTLSEVIFSNDDIKQALLQWENSPFDYPSLLLWGHTGTGKTTIAQAIKNDLEDRFDTLIIYASINNGVDDMREHIITFCKEGTFSEGKLVILDEADRLSIESQNMLRNIMDRFNKSTRFILTANYVSRISEPVAGRCLSIEITNPSEQLFKQNLIKILDKEGYVPDDEIVDFITRMTYPSVRNAINELQKLVLGITTNKSANVDDIVEASKNYLMDNISIQEFRDIVSNATVQEIEQAFIKIYNALENLISTDKMADAIIELSYHMANLKKGVFPELSLVAAMVAIKKI